MYLLIDCNQFFVSCERVFNPKLKDKPVVVLSNNDGCVIARSPEAKALGIPMGAPAYQYAPLFKEKNVVCFSSNFALYGDMSRRVMEVLSHFSPSMEEYSIDEAFLILEDCPDLLVIAGKIKETVLQWTGIPVSIGIGKTKTLAKVANDLAKKGNGIFAFFDEKEIDKVLEHLPVGEIWGIGPNISSFLRSEGIRFALQLKKAQDDWIKRHLSVITLRCVFELRGIDCLGLEEESSPRQSITYSRSFGSAVVKEEDLGEAASSYVAKALEKLRSQNSLASSLCVFVMTSRHISKPYYNHMTMTFAEPSDYTPLFIKEAKQAIKTLFRPGLMYKKVGVILGDFVSKDCYQADFFSSSSLSKEKQVQTMQVLDELNHIYGDRILRFAAEGLDQSWKMKKGNCSKRFTTCWDELLIIS